MSKVKMISPAVPNMPWQERPEGLKDAPIWRYTENPVIGRNPVKGVARIFNSAVMPYEGEFIGVFRGEQTNGIPYIYMGRSKDAIHWDFDENKINFVDEDGNPFMPVYAYDPRLVKVEDTYYIIWCGDFYGAAIGMAKTTDFKTFTRIENPFLPFNRNAVLFPRKIDGKFMMLSRPSDSGHTPFGDIFISESHDLVYWGKHSTVFTTNIFCAIFIEINPSLNTRMYLSPNFVSSFCRIIYFCLPFPTDIFERFNSRISLDTVACVTSKPSFRRYAANSSCVSISCLFISSTTTSCLCLFISLAFLNSYHYL